MGHVATGRFEPTWHQEPPYDDDPGATLARARVTKSFSGDLVGTSVADVITATSPTAGSAGYVAVERVSGRLAGRAGSFVLQHSGLSRAGGGQTLSVEVVPGTGTGELTGLAGTMSITVTESGHSYELTYTLDA